MYGHFPLVHASVQIFHSTLQEMSPINSRERSCMRDCTRCCMRCCMLEDVALAILLEYYVHREFCPTSACVMRIASSTSSRVIERSFSWSCFFARLFKMLISTIPFVVIMFFAVIVSSTQHHVLLG